MLSVCYGVCILGEITEVMNIGFICSCLFVCSSIVVFVRLNRREEKFERLKEKKKNTFERRRELKRLRV